MQCMCAVLIVTGGLLCPVFKTTLPSDYTPLGSVVRGLRAH